MEKKNTLLLTVIAVATLLVAVVGATFAYFTATSTGEKEQTVEVKTDTINQSTFAPGEAISINANLQNFGKGGEEYTGTNPKTQTDSNTATVTFKAGTAAAADMCYTAGLQITKNTFENSSGFVSPNNQGPELNITVTKNGDPIYTKLGIIGADFKTGTLYYPLTSSDSANKSQVKHKISATQGGKKQDIWTTTVTFVYDPEHSQNGNAGAEFTGKIVFSKLDSCK